LRGRTKSLDPDGKFLWSRGVIVKFVDPKPDLTELISNTRAQAITKTLTVFQNSKINDLLGERGQGSSLKLAVRAVDLRHGDKAASV